MKELGRQVFDLASEDAQEFEEIKDSFGGWLKERQGSGVVADDDGVASVGGTPTTKKIKLLDA